MEENTDSIFQVFACTLCKKVFKTRGALRIHKQKHYSSSMKYPPAICVDSKRGIFMIRFLFADQVLLAPVHVQSHKQKQIQFCGNEICLSFMMRPNLKNPAMECCQRLLQVQQKRWSSMKNI